MRTFKTDKLITVVSDTRKEMGRRGADDCAARIMQLLSEKDSINMIFAAAPSQNEFLEALVSHSEIPFERINAFHMDEYIGLDRDAPQGFGNFLDRAIFGKVRFRNVFYILNSGDPEKDAQRYTELLSHNPIDIVCMGIGENGHIAFNDPWVADFHDPEIIKKVRLDEKCRNQQVHDGCFGALEQVPEYALTLTVPTLFRCDYVFCVVPASSKAEAVKRALYGEIHEDCPSSILRLHENAVLYLDPDSAALIGTNSSDKEAFAK